MEALDRMNAQKQRLARMNELNELKALKYRAMHNKVDVHEDEDLSGSEATGYDEEDRMDQESDGSSDVDIDEAVLDDIEKFTDTFKGITKRYRLINRIGEGQFISGRRSSTVPLFDKR
jgi:hypothetical protein